MLKRKLVIFAIALLTVATFGVVQLSANAADVDNSPDCDKYAIVYCGTSSESQFQKKFNNDGHYKDHTKVFAALGIKKSDVKGMVDGIVWRDGRVTVGNKTVATGARDAARNLGGTAIPGTDGAKLTSVSTFGNAGQTAMVKMVNGVFKFAVIKSCGNPVTAKPTAKPQAACMALDVIQRNRTTFRFDARANAINGATISSYTYTIKDSSGKTIHTKKSGTNHTEKSQYTYEQTKPGTYTANVTVHTSVGDRAGERGKCTVKFTVKKPETPKPKPAAVCTDLSAKTVSRTTYNFTGKASATNGAKINSYYINFGDGKTYNGDSTTSHTYAKPGTYTAKLTAKTSVGDKTASNCAVKVTVKPAPVVPAYACDALTVSKIDRTSFAFKTDYTVKNATFKNVVYVIRDASGKEVARTSNATYKQTKVGKYSVQAYVTVTVSGKDKTVTAAACKKAFEVVKEKTPAIDIEKKVDGVEYKKVGVDQQFTYQIVVTNTGEVDLKNSVVTDNAPKGVTFLDADHGSIANNAWTYTIPELKVGKSASFAITAKVPAYLAGKIVNTACVDSPQVPGNPDDCDDATVEVPGCPVPGKENLPENSPECKETPYCEVPGKEDLPVDSPECKETPVTPPELPHTGAGDGIVALLGAGSLIAALGYYVASRRALIG